MTLEDLKLKVQRWAWNNKPRGAIAGGSRHAPVVPAEAVEADTSDTEEEEDDMGGVSA